MQPLATNWEVQIMLNIRSIHDTVFSLEFLNRDGTYF